MENVLTLVANPADTSSFSSILSVVKSRLSEQGVTITSENWLKDNIALDLYLDENLDITPLIEPLNACDYCLPPTRHRQKKLLLADMDSTIITVECIDELADFAGLKAEVSAITEQAMRGELDFNTAFKSRVAMLKGLEESVLSKTFEERVVLMGGARTLIQTMKQNGAYCALVSGGFTYFTNRVRALTGFDMDDANELLFEKGRLTGQAQEPILNSQAKLDNLSRLKAELNLERDQIAAIGDGANDIPMIEAAGLGIAFHAKPAAQAAANATIRYGDLTTLLFYQGYNANEFVED